MECVFCHKEKITTDNIYCFSDNLEVERSLY